MTATGQRPQATGVLSPLFANVRSQFPALERRHNGHPVAYFDGPGGTQVPRRVVDAMADYLYHHNANTHWSYPTSAETDAAIQVAREAVADLLNAPSPEEVVFGPNMTTLTFHLSRALARTLRPGDEVVVTRLDHDANVRPWVIAAEAAGATVRWLPFDPATGELADVATVLGDRTKLVAVTAASNLLGTRPDVPAIAREAHDAGALVYVDAVHLAAHAAVDVTDLGADLLACSPYKFFGPHLGVLAASPALLETLRPDKLLPSSDAVPERFELGTLPYELLAGVTAAVDFIAGLDSDAADRRTRVLESMAAVEKYEDELLGRLLDGLRALDGVTLHGRPARRTPTVLFDVVGHTGREVYEHLAARGVSAPASHFYAIEASRHAGLGELGAVRAGIAPYTSVEDVDRLVEGVEVLLRSSR